MKILCYGDSNTYGYDGADVFGGRFPEDARWPELLGRMLGCDSANLGLNGRRVPRFQRTIEADLALLKRSGDGLIIVMLGTNDLLAEADPEDTAAHMRHFLLKLEETMPDSAVLLCAPPPAAGFGAACEDAFRELAAAYEALSRELGVLYIDTAPWGIPTASDGIHFTGQGHRLFALKMGQTIRALLQ
jgi:lysophospholipase L1-like esterase